MVKRIKYSKVEITKLKKLIDRHTIEENNAMRADRIGKARSMYASDYGQCMRKIWYQFFPKDYPVPDFDARTLRIFHNGEAVHERLSKYLRREADIKFVEEVNIPRDDLDVHGRCDGISVIGEQAVVVEFKSINRAYVISPKEEHIGQLTWYMAMWRLLRQQLKKDFGYNEYDLIFEEDISDKVSKSGRRLDDLSYEERWVMFTQLEIIGELIYESKQTQHTDHFKIELDDEVFNKVRLWFEQLQWHIKHKQLPVVQYNKDKFPCSWGKGKSAGRCQYYDECWGKNK